MAFIEFNHNFAFKYMRVLRVKCHFKSKMYQSVKYVCCIYGKGIFRNVTKTSLFMPSKLLESFLRFCFSGDQQHELVLRHQAEPHAVLKHRLNVLPGSLTCVKVAGVSHGRSYSIYVACPPVRAATSCE